MKAGDRVRVLEGAEQGRVGVVDAIWIEGIAVRFPAEVPAWPFPRVAVLENAQLKRIRSPRRKHRMYDADGALI